MFQVSITRPQEREFERTERLSACFQDSDFGSAAICIIIVELIWLTLSAPGYLVWFWWEKAFDMKFGTVILCYVTKKKVEKNFKIAAIGMMTSLIVSIFLEKLCEKWLKYVFFLINLVIARKKIFEIFSQLLKVKITHKLNIYIG